MGWVTIKNQGTDLFRAKVKFYDCFKTFEPKILKQYKIGTTTKRIMTKHIMTKGITTKDI